MRTITYEEKQAILKRSAEILQENPCLTVNKVALQIRKEFGRSVEAVRLIIKDKLIFNQEKPKLPKINFIYSAEFAIKGDSILNDTANSFRKMNYLRFKASQSTSIDQIADLLTEANKIRNTIAKDNLGLIWNLLYYGRSLDRDEVINIGYLALLNAIDGFNYQLGFKFSTYASNTIKRKIIGECIKQNLDRITYVTNLKGLDVPLEKEPNRIYPAIDKALSELSNREQYVIYNRFGFNDGIPKHLSQIGNQLGLSKERIRQIESRALTKLKEKLVDI